MLMAALPFLLLGAALVGSAVASRRKNRYPTTYSLVPAAYSGLDAAEFTTSEGLSQALQSAGYHAAGDFKTVFQHDETKQVEQLRFWISPDRKTVVTLKRISHFLNLITRSTQEVALMTWTKDGACFITHQGPPESTPAVPGISIRAVSSTSFETLRHEHARHQAEAARTPLVEIGDADPPERYRSYWEREMNWLHERGLLRIQDGYYAPTFWLGLWTAERALNPFRRGDGSRLSVAVKMGLGGLASLGAAWLLPAVLERTGQPVNAEVALAGVYLAVGLAYSFLLPKGALAAWQYVTAPAHVVSVARGTGTGAAWSGSLFGVLCLHVVFERVRQARAEARMAAAGHLPLTWTRRTALVAAALGLASVGIGILSVVALQIPPDANRWIRSLGQSLFAFWSVSALTLVIGLPLLLVRSVRQRRWFRLVRVAMFGALIVLAGLAIGTSLAQSRGRRRQERAMEICSALRRFKEDTGAYPKTLTELVPGWLEGLSPQEEGFEYYAIKTRDGKRFQMLQFWVGWNRISLDPEVQEGRR